MSARRALSLEETLLPDIDGIRFFHRLEFVTDVEKNRAKASAIHHCGNDVYKVAFSVGSQSSMQIDWRVTGPRKDYIMETHYERMH